MKRQSSVIPVMRPQLPPARALLPYLRRIDAARTYSNWGPLVREFERRLAARLKVGEDAVVAASSGTLALAAATLATAGTARDAGKPLAIVPAFTFVATAAALAACGYECFIADVDEKTWMLDPERLRTELGPKVLRRTGVVVPVAPFGRPVPQRPWKEFQRATGIPVVIDGAPAIEGLMTSPDVFLGDIPVAISLHATKSLGVGEGGCVVSTRRRFSERVSRALNYGFFITRESRSAGLNGKMSEYHAAVGLANLDGWFDRVLARRRRVAEFYGRRLRAAALAARFVSAPDISTTYALFRGASASQARSIRAALRKRKVDTRQWYGAALHRHALYSRNPREGDLGVAEDLASCLIGLPMAPDLSSAKIGAIVGALSP